MILIRVYGHNSELMINRMSEIRNMMLLHENGCGSELYASFQNGLAYQFLPGSTLTLETVVDPGMFPLVAEACAKMHSIKIPGMLLASINKGCKLLNTRINVLNVVILLRYILTATTTTDSGNEPCIWDILRKFHQLSPDGFPELPVKDARYHSSIPFTKSELLLEINKMEKLLGKEGKNNAKIVFAHNDLLLGNILCHQGPL